MELASQKSFNPIIDELYHYINFRQTLYIERFCIF